MVYENGFRLKDSVYNVLKWIALICLPTLAVFYAIIAKIWNLPFESEIPATINAVAALIGGLIGVSHFTMKKEAENETK